MVLRGSLDPDQDNFGKQQLMEFGNDLEDLFDPTECAHKLEDVKSASCNAATWF
jgi:hypothetical protein